MMLAGAYRHPSGWTMQAGPGNRVRFPVHLPRKPYAVRALLLEQPGAISYVRFGAMNQTIAEAWNDHGQMDRRGGYAVLPFSHYWAKDRRWRDFGALAIPRDMPGAYFEVDIELSRPIDSDLRAFALAFATPSRSAEVLDLSEPA